MQELVTIAIPAYKRRWLAEAIDSALAQDYKNIELVIVNDHSPQNLDEVVEPYLSDSRVRYFVNEKNLGKESIVHNWNRCLELARGEYFVLLCDDDFLMPNFVSTLLALAEKYPHCNVFHGRRCVKDENTGEMVEDEPWPEYETFEEFLGTYMKGNRKHTITEFLYRTIPIRSLKFKVYPLGWTSDEASLLLFTKGGGLSSSQKAISVFRRSSEHLSNRNLYQYEKCLAWIDYYSWLRSWLNEDYKEKCAENLNFYIYSVYVTTSFVIRLRILASVPTWAWSNKQKIILFFKLCRDLIHLT